MAKSTLLVFDNPFASAIGPLRAGEHRRDHPSVDGGRWSVSVVAGGLTDCNRATLAELTRQAHKFAGPGHFVTGDPRAVHVTVRALESYRESASPDDAIVQSWCKALQQCADKTEPLLLELTGVTLTTSSVLAQLECVDDRPWQMQRCLAEALGPLGEYEANFDRNIWYCSLLHFTNDVADPAGLIDWVDAHRRLTVPEPVVLTSLELVRFRHVTAGASAFMAPPKWVSFAFTARTD